MPQSTDVKIFVPAKDFKVSLDFYVQLGWKLNWNHNKGLAELELANCRFLLQDFYIKEWAHNFMMYINVSDSQEWYTHIDEVIRSDQRFKECRVNPPKDEGHGIVTYVWDPSGVLLHFSQEKRR